MTHRSSSISPDWWDYTCLDKGLINEVASLTSRDLEKVGSPGTELEFAL